MNSHQISRGVMVVICCAACSSILAEEPYFQGLGDLPGGVFASSATAVSANGQVVVGRSVTAGLFSDDPYRWTRETGMVQLTPANAFVGGRATDVSFDGTVIVGSGTRDDDIGEAWRWTSTQGIHGLGDLPGGEFSSSAFGVSADKAVAIGWSRSDRSQLFEAFTWTIDDGMLPLGDLPGGIRHSIAIDLTPDGAMIVGMSYSSNGREAFYWTQAEGMVPLGDLPGGLFEGGASAVSVDGSVIGGSSRSERGIEAFRWTRETGMVQIANPFGELVNLGVDGMSADGSVMVGDAGLAVGTDPVYYWDAEHGMRGLREVLVNDHGLNLDGWLLTDVADISADGRTIVGSGQNPQNQPEGWIAYLGPPPCPSDLDGDGSVGLSDLIRVLDNFGESWTAVHPRGDVNYDLHVDLKDLGLVLSAFGTSCE